MEQELEWADHASNTSKSCIEYSNVMLHPRTQELALREWRKEGMSDLLECRWESQAEKDGGGEGWRIRGE